MRISLTLLTFVVGAALALISYFLLAAPLGIASNVESSEPKVQFAPLLFVIGISIAVLSAVVYEVLPDEES